MLLHQYFTYLNIYVCQLHLKNEHIMFSLQLYTFTELIHTAVNLNLI